MLVNIEEDDDEEGDGIQIAFGSDEDSEDEEGGVQCRTQ